MLKKPSMDDQKKAVQDRHPIVSFNQHPISIRQ
jgi:hypothetical protein